MGAWTGSGGGAEAWTPRSGEEGLGVWTPGLREEEWDLGPGLEEGLGPGPPGLGRRGWGAGPRGSKEGRAGGLDPRVWKEGWSSWA